LANINEATSACKYKPNVSYNVALSALLQNRSSSDIVVKQVNSDHDSVIKTFDVY